MTSESAAAAGLPGLSHSFTEAWELFRDRLWLSLVVGSVGTIGSVAVTVLPVILAFLFVLLLPAWVLWPAATLAALSASLWAASWAQIAVMEAFLDPYQKPTWQQCFRAAWPKVLRFSWVFLLLVIAVSGGLCFFLLPGLYLGIALAVAPVVAVAEDAAGLRALTRSLELVRGRFWPVALRLFVLGVIWVVIGRIPWIGWLLSGFVTLFILALITILYRELRDLPPQSSAAGSWVPRLALGLAALGLLLAAWLSVKTAAQIQENLPAFEAQYQEMLKHPPDPQKAQQALELLQSGATEENLRAAWKLLAPNAPAQPTAAVSLSSAAATSGAPGETSPAGAPVQ